MDKETVEEILIRLKSAIYDTKRMTTGNVAHLKPQIIGQIEISIEKLEKLMEFHKVNKYIIN